MQFKYYLGIDVSKEKLDYCLLNSGGQKLCLDQSKNQVRSIENLLCRMLRDLGIGWHELLVCCESSGIYTRMLEAVASKGDLRLWLEHPMQIKRASGIQRQKTDQHDAFVIAQYAWRFRDQAQFNGAFWFEFRPLGDLIAKRTRTAKMIHGTEVNAGEYKRFAPRSQQLHACSEKQVLLTLKKRRSELDKLIEEEVRRNPLVSKNYHLLRSVPGIGPFTAAYLIYTTWNFTRLNKSTKLASYAGVAPFSNTTGNDNMKTPRCSPLADKELKRLLHLSALNAVRSDHGLARYYKRKCENKPRMLAINNIRNKLLQRICSVIRRQEAYIIDQTGEKPKVLSKKKQQESDQQIKIKANPQSSLTVEITKVDYAEIARKEAAQSKNRAERQASESQRHKLYQTE